MTCARRGDDVRAQRLVLRTQSRSVGLWSAAVSAEDQPQHGKKGGGWGIVPRRSEDVRAQRLVLRTQSRSVRPGSAAVSAEDQPQVVPANARQSRGNLDSCIPCSQHVAGNP